MQFSWDVGSKKRESECKASDSEHEIVMTNKEDFMRRNEKAGEIARKRGRHLQDIELDIAINRKITQTAPANINPKHTILLCNIIASLCKHFIKSNPYEY